jgi:hypothetical protein
MPEQEFEAGKVNHAEAEFSFLQHLVLLAD